MSLSFTKRHSPWDASEPLSGVRPAAVRYGTPGNDFYKGGGDYDMSQGGDDRLRLGGNDDSVYFGAAFTGADRVNGLKGVDTVTLDGDYSAGIEIEAKSLVRIERLVLEGGTFVVTGELDYKDEFDRTSVDARSLTVSQSLHLNVSSAAYLDVTAGAGDDVLYAAESGNGSNLYGGDGADTLIGGAGDNVLQGSAGADRIVMVGAGDLAVYVLASDSAGKTYDTIDNFADSGGKVWLTFDSDTSTPERDHDFSFRKTTDRTGNILFKYDAASDQTIVKVFTDPDHKADMVLHLTGDVQLTTADFIFG